MRSSGSRRPGSLDYLEWEAIDDRSARVTIQQPGVKASALLFFNDQDQLTGMTAERYMLVAGKPVLEQWETRGGDYREAHGLRIPFQAEALWKLPAGDFSYFRGEITEINYT